MSTRAAWWTRPSSPSAGSSQAAWWSGWCWLSSPSSGSKAPAPWVRRLQPAGVPRAILWSCGVVGVFYLIVSYAQLYGFGSARFAKASAPLAQLSGVVGLRWLGHFIAFGITCSMFACTLACLTAGSRMLLSLGLDGLMLKAFTRTFQARQRAGDRHLGRRHPDDRDSGRLHHGRKHGHRALHRRGRYARHLRLHARLRPGSPGRASVPGETPHAEAAHPGAWRTRRGDNAVRLLRELDSPS